MNCMEIFKSEFKFKNFKGFYPLFLFIFVQLKCEFQVEIFVEPISIRSGIVPIGFTQFGLKLKKLC